MNPFRLYLKSYSGLTEPAWILALVILVNRSGSMVLPFLSIYLREDLNFSIENIGIILSLFGAGSLVGSYLGGWLTDKIGSYLVQTFSLILGGIGFLILKELETFESIAAGFFLVTIVTDALRPANSTAIAEYAKKENLTRAYSLNRMAVNLGFSIGPAAGGFLAAMNYELLFYVDGFTCILAGVIFAIYFSKKAKRNPVKKEEEVFTTPPKSPYKDVAFMMFIVFVAGYGIVFFQLFNTLPLYYREIYILPENTIGWLLALNGFIVFLVEMPLVSAIGNRIPVRRIVAGGAILAGLAYLLLNLHFAMWILVVSMIVLSLSEILAMPYMTTYTVSHADTRNRGKYLGLYSVGYSIAFILAPASGTYLIDHYGFQVLWYVMALASIIVFAGLFAFMKPLKAMPPLPETADN